MEIDKMLRIIEDPESGFMAFGIYDIEYPFPINAMEYLAYSEEDLKVNSNRAIVNALSNAKRSLDCRIEEILYSFGLRGIAKKKRWNIPKKLEIISELGIVTPRILKKLNSLRNLLEHEFHKPSKEQTEDFVDVASLFNEGTKIYLFNVPDCPEITDDPDYGDGDLFNFELRRVEPVIVLDRKNILDDSHEFYQRFAYGYAKMVSRTYA